MIWRETTLGRIGQIDVIMAFLASKSIDEMRRTIAAAYLPVVTDGDDWHIIGRYEVIDG